MRTEVHQFLPSLAVRDAVGNHTLETHRALTSGGFRAGIWAEGIHPDLSRTGRPYLDYGRRRSAKRGTNVILYQASTGSWGLVEYLVERRERKSLFYHNITPPECFEPYDPATALLLARGREELKLLAAQVPVAMAASEFNARELQALGVGEVRVMPPYLPPKLGRATDPALASHLRRTKQGIDLLFVGRVVPNKGHRHLLRAFAAFQAAVCPTARLFVVGAWGPQSYMQQLFRIRERLGLEGVTFTGSISDEHLTTYYRACDVFLCLSEHEGFGLPLIEAMRMGLPVVAYDSSAIGETLGGAGVLVRDLDPAFVAEVVGRVAYDEGMREQIAARQRDRVEAIEGFPRDVTMRALMEELLAL